MQIKIERRIAVWNYSWLLSLEKVSHTCFHRTVVTVGASGRTIEFEAQHLIQSHLEGRSMIIIIVGCSGCIVHGRAIPVTCVVAFGYHWDCSHHNIRGNGCTPNRLRCYQAFHQYWSYRSVHFIVVPLQVACCFSNESYEYRIDMKGKKNEYNSELSLLQ